MAAKKRPRKTPEQKDIDYNAGRRSAYRALLGECAHALGFEDPKDPEAMVAWLLAERADVVAALREVCESHGDNDWPDNLHLSDVINKHLAPYLDNEDDGE